MTIHLKDKETGKAACNTIGLSVVLLEDVTKIDCKKCRQYYDNQFETKEQVRRKNRTIFCHNDRTVNGVKRNG